MSIKQKQLFTSFFALISIGLMSCKTDVNDARIKTLDSIANGSLNLDAYQCKGSNTTSISDQNIVFDKASSGQISDNKKSELRRAVKDYFSALPESAESLFLKLGGQILITNRSSEICAASHYGRNLDEDKGEKTDGCFHFVNDPTNRKGAIFAIVHSADAKKIRYYGPQIFGYLYAQFYSRLTLSNDRKGLVISDAEPMQLVTLKEKVANAFLSDIHATKNYKIDVLENLLGDNANKELNNTEISSPIERFTSLKDQKRRSQFLDYVYANSFQSAHCNNTSREVARSKFKRSSNLFADINQAVKQVSLALDGKTVSSDNRNANSFSLTQSELSLAGGDFLSSIMPLFGNLLGMSGASSGGGIADLFSQLLSGVGQSTSAGASIQDSVPQIGKFASALFSQLSSAGCQGGNCTGCNGSCSGGSCSSCANGSCGGSCGSCSVNS